MKKKLSLRGKIGLIPSLFITIPLFAGILILGLALWIVAKIFNFVGITEAIQYQLRAADNGILKGKALKKALPKNEFKEAEYETE